LNDRVDIFSGLAGLAALCVSGAVSAQMVDATGKRIDAFMIDEAPVLDGVLDDDAWAFAAVITDLYQVTPEEFAPPSEESQIYVVYTKDALYVGARFYDREPDKIGALVLRQGDFSWGEDTITVMIDPLNQGRSGYAFDLTANGLRNQALYQNVTKQNWAWQGIWHGEARLDDQGWVAEIEIPFKTLSFDPSNDIWGLNVGRYIGRKTEQIGWTSRNRDMNPSAFGEITGMSGAQKGVGLDVVPSARVSQSKDFEAGVTSDSVEPAIDVFYKLTSSLTASLTVNTDFSGTSADARQVNLTRFGLFFPEKRVFFLQDTDIFEFGQIGGRSFDDRSTISRVEKESGRPFFSRRIGLSGGGETIPIDYGGKLTGRAGGWEIGTLGIRQEPFQSLGASDLFVARVSRNVFEESSLGFIFTSGDPDSDLGNTLAGVDYRYLNTRLSSGSTLEGSLWYQQSDSEGIDGDDAAYGISLRVPTAEGLRYGLSYKELQENYYPALGFVNRNNVRDLTVDIGYTWFPAGGSIQRAFSGVDYQRIETLQNQLQSELLSIRALEIVNGSGDSIELQYQLIDEVLDTPFEVSEGVIIPVGEYGFDQYCVNIGTGQHRRLAVEGYYCGGEFFDGDISAPGADITWRPNEHFRFALGYHVSDIDLPYGAFITRLASLRADIAFTNTLYWENTVQYDNVSYGLGLNSILRWVPRAGREVILVANREFVDYTRDRTFTSVTGDITFKFGYTFRF
jgi:hypothetical protein